MKDGKFLFVKFQRRHGTETLNN